VDIFWNFFGRQSFVRSRWLVFIILKSSICILKNGSFPFFRSRSPTVVPTSSSAGSKALFQCTVGQAIATHYTCYGQNYRLRDFHGNLTRIYFILKLKDIRAVNIYRKNARKWYHFQCSVYPRSWEMEKLTWRNRSVASYKNYIPLSVWAVISTTIIPKSSSFLGNAKVTHLKSDKTNSLMHSKDLKKVRKIK
jgi:hypothetical protein